MNTKESAPNHLGDTLPRGSMRKVSLMRKLLLVLGAALLLALFTAPAVQAAVTPDYPPTVVSGLGTPGGVGASGVSATSGEPGAANSSLPRTGGNSRELIWVGLASLGAGAFAVSSFRRRTRTA